MNTQQNDMMKLAVQLYIVGAGFDYFLAHVVHSKKDFPFLSGLLRMITTEEELCQSQT